MQQKENTVAPLLPVAAIVLAAGQGSRMGGGKLLLPLGETTVIEHTVQNLLLAGAQEVIVVIGVYGVAIQWVLRSLPVRFSFNPDPTSEMAESIRCGLRRIEPQRVDAFCILPGDMPLVLPETVRRVVTALLNSDRQIAVPVYQRRRGHPVVFRSDLYEQVLTFRSPQGIRPLVHGDPSRVLLVEVDDEGVVADLDSWDDYRRLVRLWVQRRGERKNPAHSGGKMAG